MFLKQAAAGMMLAQKHAPVAIRGRRIKTVDAHAHCVFEPVLDLLKKTVQKQEALVLRGQALDDRLAAMDGMGIDVAVLGSVPNWYDAPRDVASEVVTRHNELLAAFCGSHRDRFVGLGAVALQYPDMAAQQLERAVGPFGFRGVAIGASVAGAELSDRKFDPFWATAERLNAAVFIHPTDGPDPLNRFAGNGVLGKVIGHPLETTVALSHLIFEGTLDRFPNVKICASHGGGFLASYPDRSDHGCDVFPGQCTPGVPKLAPSAYLKRMYFDSIVFTSEALRHLAAEVGAGQILMGTDYPYPWSATPVDHILQTPGLSDADREAMLGGTARRLLGIQ